MELHGKSGLNKLNVRWTEKVQNDLPLVMNILSPNIDDFICHIQFEPINHAYKGLKFTGSHSMQMNLLRKYIQFVWYDLLGHGSILIEFPM